MICSSDPLGMIRASTASDSNNGTPSDRRGEPSGSPAMRATSPSYGTTTPTWPRADKARNSSSVCQPERTERMETFMPGAGDREPSWFFVQRRLQHLCVHVPGMKRTPAGRARQPHLAGAEEQRIDLVEVVLVAFE